MKKALIIGIAGQDGAYLGKFLLNMGYKVIGLHRNLDEASFWRLKKLKIIDEVEKVFFDLANYQQIKEVLKKFKPDEIYNLGGITSVSKSFEDASACYEINGISVYHILDEISKLNFEIKYYQASSSEMFGSNNSKDLDENSNFKPVSPYGISKVFAHHNVGYFRKVKKIFACSGIAFNHESKLRGNDFLSSKVIKHVLGITNKNNEILEVGNLMVERDWGYAPEFVKGMHAILNYTEPDDYILATGKSHSVKDFISETFDLAGHPIYWEGKGKLLKGYFSNSGKIAVNVNQNFYRPSEAYYSNGNADKAYKVLGWKGKTDLKNLIIKLLGNELV